MGNGGLSHRGPDFLYRNLRENSFEKIDCDITTDTTATIGGLWADFNNDRRPDFFLTDQFGPEVFFFNEGAWKFRRVALQKPREADIFPNASATATDFDNDGDLDVFLCGMYGSINTLYVNDGSGNFSLYKTISAFPEGGHSYLGHWMDVDNNGWMDLVVLNWGAAPVLYLNDRGEFKTTDVPGLTDIVLYPATMASGDFQHDGLLDFIIGQWPNFPGEHCRNLVFQNATETKHHWVGVKLTGSRSNRSAVGARILITAVIGGETITQLREVNTQPTWRSQSDFVQHFGLGDAEQILELEVQWPSGARTMQQHVPINRVLEIDEEPASMGNR